MTKVNRSFRLEFSLEIGLTLLVLTIVSFYTYAYFFAFPYLGFTFSSHTGQIELVFVQPASGESLQPGDTLIKVGSLDWANYENQIYEPLLGEYQAGDPVQLVILRNGQEIPFSWILPGPNRGEILYHLTTPWWLALIFWMAGAATLFLVRPTGARSRLLVAFNYLLAIWLASGFVSALNISESTFVLVVTSWLIVPVSWHFHWIFPRSLGNLPGYIWVIIYLVSAFIASLILFNRLPIDYIYFAIILAAIGSLGLLVIHMIFQPQQRRLVGVLFTGLMLACFPGILYSFLRLFNLDSLILMRASAFAFLIVPVAYFYVIYRRQLGGLELRANRVFSLLVYAILLLTTSTFLATLADAYFQEPHIIVLIGTLLGLLAGIVTAIAYPHFERWIERHILGIPIPPTKLVEAYTARITTSLEMERLVHLIRDEVLPSLLIRQAALLRLDSLSPSNGSRAAARIFTLDVKDAQLPRPEVIPSLLAEAGTVRFFRPDGEITIPCPWVRLVLRLSVEDQPVGLFLFGRRDPDDSYAATEIPTLQALADQTALALVNIEQAERLHALYQADIERQEAERNRLAFELHDGVLGQLAMLAMNMDDGSASEQFSIAYQTTVQRIREIIIGLRPAMLDFSLPSALQELVDEASEHITGRPKIELDLFPSDARYPQEVELHLFRIVQQACQNAIQHAQAGLISIRGQFEPDKVDLLVKDDGKGFIMDEESHLSWLLANHHYGLATMHERAALIDACIQLSSSPGQGTQIHLVWEKTKNTGQPGDNGVESVTAS
jgi:signal transduction histidine kinase